MVDFAGWELPVFYKSGAIEEHHATRRSVGLFDIDHMGQFAVSGPDAQAFIDRVLSSNVEELADGEAKYGLLCSEAGTVVDDVIVYRFSSDRWLVVVNAANRPTDLAWLTEHSEPFDATVTDRSSELAMIAVQGPNAVRLVDSFTTSDLNALDRFSIVDDAIGDAQAMIARTGYTGEDGVELYVDGDIVSVWTQLLARASELDIEAAAIGLGARDSLRFEPGYPLYGHELSLDINPFEARLSWAVDLDHSNGSPRSFIGADALRSIKANGMSRRLETLTMIDKGVPREGSRVLDDAGTELGLVVSGMFAPTADVFACSAFLPRENGTVGAELIVDIRGRQKKAVVAKRPLYRR